MTGAIRALGVLVPCLLLAAACELPLGNGGGDDGPGTDDTGGPPDGPCRWPGAEGSVVRDLVVVHTQADVDRLAGCTEVGSLQISGTTDVTNLDALASLTAVRNFDGVVLGGMLSIDSNAGLADLSGLRNLEVVEWGMSLTSNAVLRQASLPSLRQVGTPGDYCSGLPVQSNPLLTLLDLGALEEVVSTFSIIANGALEDVRLNSLQSVSGERGDLIVGQNDRLQALAFPSLQSVEGDLALNYGTALWEIRLPMLSFVRGWIGVSYQQALTRLELPMLAGDVDGVFVRENDALALVSMPSLQKVVDLGRGTSDSEGDFLILKNPLLFEFDFSALQSVAGSLQVGDNPDLPASMAEDLLAQVDSGSGESAWGNGEE